MAATYQLGRHCPLCDHRIPDKHPSDFCCGTRIPGGIHIEITTQPPGTPDRREQPEVFTMTHTKVTPGGQRRYAGKDAAGARVVLDEIAS